MTIKWIKFDINNIPKKGKPYLITDGKGVDVSPWPCEEWGLFYGGIRRVSVVTHYAEITLPGEIPEMNTYLIVFHNRFACQIQTYKVEAKNKFRAGRMFYKAHNRKQYHACIETITEVI